MNDVVLQLSIGRIATSQGGQAILMCRLRRYAGYLHVEEYKAWRLSESCLIVDKMMSSMPVCNPDPPLSWPITWQHGQRPHSRGRCTIHDDQRLPPCSDVAGGNQHSTLRWSSKYSLTTLFVRLQPSLIQLDDQQKTRRDVV